MDNNSTHSNLFKLLESSRPDLLKNIKEAKINNQAITKQLLYETLQIDQQLLRLSRKLFKYDHSKLVKDSLNNKSLLFTQFNQFLEMLNRDQYHSISEHNQEVITTINNYVNSLGEEINYKPEIKSLHSNHSPIEMSENKLIKIKKFLFIIYNQLEFGRVNQIKENSAAMLSDPERPSKVDPVIVDHEYLAKFYFAYILQIKSVNCYQGSGSPDLIVSTHDLKGLGLIENVEKGYLYADFKTGSHTNFGYDEVNDDHNINKFIKFVTNNLDIDLLIIDVHPYTKNINENNIEKLDKLFKYLNDCKDELKKSGDEAIKDKKFFFYDSNIPKIDIDVYYDKLARLNGIDSEAFDLFKELIEGYIDYLEKKKLGTNQDGISDMKTQSIDDLSNNYTRNDIGIYVPQHLASSSENQKGYLSSNTLAAKSVALTLKYINTTHLTDEELDDFFSE